MNATFGYFDMVNPPGLTSVSPTAQHVSLSNVPMIPAGAQRTVTFWW